MMDLLRSPSHFGIREKAEFIAENISREFRVRIGMPTEKDYVMEGATELERFFKSKDEYKGDVPLFPIVDNGVWTSYWVRVGDAESEFDAVRTLQWITAAWKSRRLDDYLDDLPSMLSSHARVVKDKLEIKRRNIYEDAI